MPTTTVVVMMMRMMIFIVISMAWSSQLCWRALVGDL